MLNLIEKIQEKKKLWGKLYSNLLNELNLAKDEYWQNSELSFLKDLSFKPAPRLLSAKLFAPSAESPAEVKNEADKISTIKNFEADFLSNLSAKKMNEILTSFGLKGDDYSPLLLLDGELVYVPAELNNKNESPNKGRVELHNFDLNNLSTADATNPNLLALFDFIEKIEVINQQGQSKKELEQYLMLLKNLAETGSAITLKLKENFSLSKPLLLLSLSRETEENLSQEDLNTVKLASNPIIFLDLEKNAKLDLVEFFSNAAFSNTTFSNDSNGQSPLELKSGASGNALEGALFREQNLLINLQEQATLNHFTYQNEKDSSYFLQEDFLRLKKKSQYNSLVVQSGAKIGISKKKVWFEGREAEAQLSGLYLGQEEKILDHIIDLEHIVPGCLSEQSYMGLIRDKSVVGFTGKVTVYRDAQETNSSQMNRTIVFDKTATIRSRPQLEIFADDVKCGHGATVGKFDEESLFYLMSRGIDKLEAERILANAFAGEFLEKLNKSFPILLAWVKEQIYHSSFWDTDKKL